ncbi:MAG: DedA family protein [Blastocatellia bacterium]
MESVESLIGYLQTLSPLGVLAFVFLFAYIENIFPPSPSDALIVVGGTLIAVDTVGFIPMLLASTLGSTLGFMTAYLAGRYFERHVVEGRFSRFLPGNAIQQVENLFQRFGYGVIIINRFLSGTRAVVSFAAGMSRMNLTVTTLLSAVSAAVWNAILLLLGKGFGGNWRRVVDYLALYGKIVTVVVLIGLALFAWRFWRKRRQAGQSTI